MLTLILIYTYYNVNVNNGKLILINFNTRKALTHRTVCSSIGY